MSPTTAAATIEMLESRVKDIEASKDPDGAPLLDFYRKSISLIEQRRNHEVATEEFIKARELAPKAVSQTARATGKT